MASNYILDFVSGQLAERSAGVRPTVERPSVRAPNPFEDEDKDRRFEKFRINRPRSDSGDVTGSSFYRSSDSDTSFSGQFQVSTLPGTVESQFTGAPSALRGAMAPVGFGAFMGIGSAMSYKMLSHIEKKMLEGDPNYGLAVVNGRLVGVSPGILGDKSYGFTGVLPGDLTHNQRVELRNLILGAGKPLPYRQTPDYFPGAVDQQVGVAPPPEPTDEERAAAAGSNIVYDDSGNPVKVGGTDDYVTTQSGRYVDQAELQRQNQAKQAADAEAARQERARAAAEEAARSQMAAQRDDSDDNNQPRNEYSIGTGGSSNPADRGYSMRAKGGRVGMADGGSADPVQKTGFVEGSPDNYTKAQTVADDENRQVRVGSFVLNAPTTEKLQKAGVLPKGVDNLDKNTTIKANKGGMMDVALSKGEYVLEPEEAKEIGYDILNKINDQGKPEVDRRQAMGHGGMTGTKEEIEAALTGTPTPAPTNFQNIILQDGPVELEYRHGESEFDGSYPSLDARDIEGELSPEAQAVLRNNPGLQTQLFTDMGPRIIRDNQNFMSTAQSMTAYDHMRQFERRGLGKLFPGATANEIMALTANPDITIGDKSETGLASGTYSGLDDEIMIYPHTIDLLNRLRYGYKGQDISKLTGIAQFNLNDPIEEIYTSTVESVTYHELLHMAYAKKMRRNLPFRSTGVLEMYTNMGFVGGDERNWTPSDVLKERADIEAQLSKVSGPRAKSPGLRKGADRKTLLQRQEELNDIIRDYQPDQNHSAMMYYEIERIMDETNDFPIDKRVIARQYVAGLSFGYIPKSRKSEIVRMRMQILKRPENKELLAALRKEEDFVTESKYFFVKPEFYAKFAVQNPELLPALDRFTNEFLTTTREIHAHYSDEFRAALNARDVYDLPIGSTIRRHTIDNLRERDSVKRYPEYWGNKDRMYKIPPQIDLITAPSYDPTDRRMVVPDEALRQFIFKPDSFIDSSATR
tara:strand:- start:1 stop:2922 length:2922 start_codon:yes stop_codon:yes gene_type:complete